MLGTKYKIENFDYFKNNIDKLLSTQSKVYGIAFPARNQSIKISDWAKDAVYNMLSLGIMEGIGENFSPKGTYTKEQAITTMVRLYNALSIGETQAQ